MVDDQPRVAVVGGGISGLAAAFHLTNAGIGVDLIERDEDLGGRLGVAQLGARPVMMGGKNIGRKYSGFRAFAAELGCDTYEEFGINSSRVVDGRLRTFDSKQAVRSLRNALGTASPRDYPRLLRLARRVRVDDANRFLGAPAFAALAERCDHEPLSAHFAESTTRNLLRPMTVRMNGAEPDEVYLGTFGTNLALVLDTFDQLRYGIQPALAALAERVNLQLHSPVEALAVEGRRITGLRTAGSDLVERYDGVVLAVPAPAAASILRIDLPNVSARLEQVRYFPTTVALVEYDRPVFSEQVRALAMDDGPCSNVGAYGKDDRHIARYTFSGRAARHKDPSPALIERWLDEAESRLRHFMPESRRARRVKRNIRHWALGYCGYVPFHPRFLEAVRRGTREMAGLALAGDYLQGASIEACFRSGEQAARELAEQLRTVPVA